MEAGGLLPRALVPGAPLQQANQQNALQPMGEMLPPKRQAVVDRLRRRIESYRRRQTECIPRFDQSFSGVCEQQNVETSLLQKRFLEGKAKRQAKKTDRKQPDNNTISGNLHSSVHVQQKFGGAGDYSPPPKMQRGCGVGGGGGMPRNDGLTKFSVEIVQQLEFTTSAASSQPQQISTNVTVKALTNASVKNDCGTPPPPAQQQQGGPVPAAPAHCGVAPLECKRELPDDDFADLDQCAAALDKDAAAADFPGLGDLIGEDDRDEIIDSDAFDDLISEISEYPEFMKDFDLDGKSAQLGEFTLKVEDTKDSIGMNGGAQLGLGAFGARLPPYSAGGDLSPAAHTLKQMAEQHQHKSGAGGEWGAGAGAARGVPQGGASRLYGGPYAPRPPPLHHHNQQLPHHLHMSQAQQMHISQPLHHIQVSAGQQMQLSGELKPGGQVSVAAQQGLYFSHGQHNQQPNQTSQHNQHSQQHSQHHPHQQQQNMSSPQHQQGINEPTYTVSQSQTINFTQQSLRQRHQQATPQGMHAPGPAPTAQAGGGVMSGMPNTNATAAHINVTGAAREHHAKMLQHQQQQMLRAQQQQMQNVVRPPPPEYKAATHLMQHARLTNANMGNGIAPTPIRGGLPRPHQWRANLLPSAATLTPNYHQQATFQQRFQQQRLQHHLLQQHHRAQHQQQQIPQQNMMSHLVMQQNQVVNVQGQMSNIHMNQNQSVSMQQQQHTGMMMPATNGMTNVNHNPSSQMQMQAGGPGPPVGSVSQPFSNLQTSSFPGQTADFNLDFLDSMPSGDSSNFTAQDLLNSLDNVPGFNINDIL